MKTQHNIFRITAAALAAATLLSGCMKDELKQKEQAAPNGGEGEYELIVEVGGAPATKTTITQDGTILPVVWKTGDKLYVAGATDGYIGCMELEATQASGEGVGYHKAKFKGKMSGWTSTQVLHFYYLGSSEPTLTDNKFTFDISSQEGTLAWIEASGHISHAATESALAPGSHTLSLTMNNMNAVILYDLSAWTSGVNVSGTYKSAELDLVSATFTGTTGDIAIPAANCTAQTYVTIIPDPDPTQVEKSLTFKQGTASTPTKSNRLEPGRFYSDAGNAIKIAKLDDDGSLPGLFPISPTKWAKFSKGNLWCDNSDASNPLFYFEDEQYNYRTTSGHYSLLNESRTTDGTPVNTYGIFAWSTDNTNNPWGMIISTDFGLLRGNFKDWGENPIINGGNQPNLWRTLSKDEWAYLINNSLLGGKKMYNLTLSNGSTTVIGAMLKPYDYSGTVPSSTNVSWEEWQQLEKKGVVFIPTPGNYNPNKSEWLGYNSVAYYYSASKYDNDNVYRADLGDVWGIEKYYLNTLRCVRLFKVYGEQPHYIDDNGDHGEGVKIGDVIWAPVNCEYDPINFPYGKLYQWGRKTGEGYAAPEVLCTVEEGPVSADDEDPTKHYTNDFDWLTPQNNARWNSAASPNDASQTGMITPVKTGYDPCPPGWRIPTYYELDVLRQNKSTWTTKDGQKGYYFTGGTTYSETASRIFLPAAGYRGYNTGNTNSSRTSIGSYWSSTVSSTSDGYAYYLYTASGSASMVKHSRAYALPIRCVYCGE